MIQIELSADFPILEKTLPDITTIDLNVYLLKYYEQR